MPKDPIVWDTYNPDRPAPEPPKPQQDLRWGAKHAPGPAIAECDECGEPANPCWSENSYRYCRTCVPDDLRYPAGKPAPTDEETT